ncbi:MAG: SUMF1/EgtB/PvdO family nonheme iron enzyme [Lewinellaceae bacterium]|nr:SUMF1/EgtB/PvdO family nonheme iron enzyme [Lewinellaceae bacterium]
MKHQNHHPIFISYRTDDTSVQAGRLCESINHHFGWEAAFHDSRLKAGEKWPRSLKEKVEQAQVVLVLMRERSKWLGVDQDLGGRRIDDPTDWVFLEVKTALENADLVIPVLFGVAELPPGGVLPDGIKSLLDCQHLRFKDDKAWDTYLAPLLKRLEEKVHRRKASAELPKPYDPLENLPILLDRGIPTCPYKELQWFTADDARIFFGREEDILKLYEKLDNRYSRVILFYGQSGAGKSSLLHAGFLPRLPEPWAAAYYRRTRDGTATDIIQKHIRRIKEEQPEQPLLILDQLEEIYTNGEPEEAEGLPLLLQEYLNTSPHARVILGYREDYHGRVDNLLRDNGITPLPHLLPVLNERKVRQAVAGILNDKELSDCYRGLCLAEGEDNLPTIIAQDLMSRPDSRGNAAPLLQYILLQMWNEVKKGRPPQFSRELYNRHRRASMLGLLDDRMEALGKSFPNEEKNGLALGLLRALVTKDNTAGKMAEPDLIQRYGHIPKERLRRLCRALEDNYLVSHYTEDNRHFWRLAHDALAPAVQRRFEESARPGQRAWYILEAKGPAALKGGPRVRFSESDVDTIQAGLEGMPDMEEALKAKIEADRQYYLAQRENNFKLAFNTAQDNIENLSHEDALTNLQLAQREGLYPEKVREKARELLYPLAFLQSTTKLEEALQLILDISEGKHGDWRELQALAQKLPPDNLFPEMEAWLQKKDEPFYRQMHERFFPSMVEVPGGTFEMGSELEWFSQENPPHEVTLAPFQLAETPVTCWQYGLYCLHTGWPLSRDSGFGRGDKPVVNVSWYETIAYLNWLSRQMGLSLVYNIEDIPPDPNELDGRNVNWFEITDWKADGFRLPTEAEWEFAAGGGAENRTVFGNGRNVADPGQMNFDCGHVQNSFAVQKGWMAQEKIKREDFIGATTPVKQFEKNALGLYDMSGNVFEWCWDWYDENYYQGSPSNDPKGPERGSYRSVRGGSWYTFALGCRSVSRHWSNPLYQTDHIGFRVSRRL